MIGNLTREAQRHASILREFFLDVQVGRSSYTAAVSVNNLQKFAACARSYRLTAVYADSKLTFCTVWFTGVSAHEE